MPSNTAPKAPIPVQIAYAVPIGSVLVASDNKYKLNTIPPIAIDEGINFVNPWEYLSAIAHMTSKTPPMIKYTQAIFAPPVSIRKTHYLLLIGFFTLSLFHP